MASAGFYAQPLDPAANRLGFALTDTRGRLRRSTEFRDQVLVLFFGFLSCPSICPTTMLELSAAQKAMGSRADRVTVAFATLDPARDTPAAIEAWLAAFGRRHLGLHDSAEAIRRAAATLKLEYTRVPGASPDSYTIDHGVQAYVFDPRGRLRLLLRPGPLPHEVASDWLRLLDGA
ncbi:MAG: SCO family protein [Aquabacterium sp.]|nr:SCO family protein [Aquabacterium sp.]